LNSRRLSFEPLEDRRLLECSEVPTTTELPFLEYPYTATVCLSAVWDLNWNGQLDAGDYVGGGSGAVIDDYHVLTAAHCVFNNDPNDNKPDGLANWVAVYPGQNGRYLCPFGEVEVWGSHITVPEQWAAGDENIWYYDLAILTLDRNIGQYTGTYGWSTDPNLVYERQNIEINHYPGDTHDGFHQYHSEGWINHVYDYHFDRVWSA